MSATTSYTSLVANVQSYLARGDLAADVPMLIQQWETSFYRQPLNFGPWMEQALAATIASDVIPVPADYLAIKNAYVDSNPSSRLETVGLDVLLGTYPRGNGPGTPAWMSRQRTNFIFGPEPDSDYDIKGTYYGKPVALRDFASDAVDNWLIVNAPDLPLYGALAAAEAFVKNDARIGVWKTFYGDALNDYRDLIKNEQVSTAGEVLS